MDNFLNSVASDFKQVWSNTDFAGGLNNTNFAGGAAGPFGGQPGAQGGGLPPEQSELPPQRNITFQGRRLFIEKLLGEGGFAFVYQVVDQSTGQKFALKKMMTQNKGSEIKQ